MTDRYYTDADAEHDNEQAGGCPIHGINNPECSCCRSCGWRRGAHSHDCENWSPNAIQLTDNASWREVVSRAVSRSLAAAGERDDCDVEPLVYAIDETERARGFVDVDVTYSGRGWRALYEYRHRDDRLFLAQD